MELMTQEIGQAGFNPQFANQLTDATAITPSATPACVTLNSISGVYPGDFLVVDVGAFMETVQVVATSIGKISGQTVCGAANQIKAVFKSCHGTAVVPCGPTGSTLPIPFTSYKFPYPTGILRGKSLTWGSSTVTISNDHILAFFGDIENAQSPQYVVYSLYNPTPGVAAPSVTINSQTYYLYNLYRSATNLTYTTGTANNNASPLVQNVIYQDITGVNPVGPTAQPIFGYPDNVNVSITPAVVTVVGTVVMNLCVAVNPKSLETGTAVQWYTMASQIRPMNLWAAVTVNVTGGSKYLVQDPLGLPMTFPALTTYY
jgi:hypothetical protein